MILDVVLFRDSYLLRFGEEAAVIQVCRGTLLGVLATAYCCYQWWKRDYEAFADQYLRQRSFKTLKTLLV